jgi:hypothetical protein
MRTAIFIFVLLSWMSSSAGTASSILIDKSAEGSPVSLVGTVNSDSRITSGRIATSFESNLQASNTSSKDILLVVIRMELTGANGLSDDPIRVNDYFFSADVFEHSASEVIRDSSSLSELLDKINLRPVLPKAVAKVIFVQFLDGSTWGRRDGTVQKALSERLAAWKRLKELSHIYQSESEQRFVSVLMEPTPLASVSVLQDIYSRNGGDVSVVAKDLDTMLLNADRHVANLRE